MCLFAMRIFLGWFFLRNVRLTSFYLSLKCLKECRQRAWSRKRALTRGDYRAHAVGWRSWGAGPGDQSPLCVPLSRLLWQTFVYQTFAFPVSCELSSSPLKSRPPYVLLLSSELCISLNCLSVGLIFLWVPHTYVIKFVFSPVNLSYVNLIIRTVK